MAYARQIATAKRLIKKYGGPAKLVVTTTVVSDPTKPWETPNDTEESNDCTACWLRYAQKYVDNEVIHAGDQKVLIAAADLATLVPNLQGRMQRTVNGATENWKIMNVNPLNVNGAEPIIYTLQVRQ